MIIKLFYALIIFFITTNLFLIECYAALVLEQISYIQSNPDKKGKGTIYISKNKIKFTESITNSTVIFDLEKNQLIRIDNESKTYAVASPEKYSSSIHNQWLKEKQKLKIDISNLPKDKRTQQVKILKERGIDIYDEEEPLNIRFTESADGEIIENYETKNYKVYRNNKLIEEYWLTKNIEGLDYEKFARFYGKMQRITSILYLDSKNIESTIDTLEKLFNNGYPLKLIDYQTNGNRIEEIIKINNITLTDDSFSPPTGYKKIPF